MCRIIYFSGLLVESHAKKKTKKTKPKSAKATEDDIPLGTGILHPRSGSGSGYPFVY